MYSEIERVFPKQGVRRNIVELFMKYGLSVKDGLVFCGEIELSFSKIARAANCDRRVVKEVVGQIEKNPGLRQVFANLRPTAIIRGTAKLFGFEVLEIEANPKTIGLVADVSQVIKEDKGCIRQIVADDPEIYPNPKITIILNKELSGNALEKIRKIKEIKKFSVQ